MPGLLEVRRCSEGRMCAEDMNLRGHGWRLGSGLWTASVEEKAAPSLTLG